MATDTVTIDKFIERNGIEVSSVRTDHNVNMNDSQGMDHWKVTLTRRAATGKRYNARKDGNAIVARMTLTFSQGSGWNGAEPKAKDVLECLGSEAGAFYTEPSFEDWCSDYGYDTDSRRALQTFKACKHQTERLRRFLGADLFEALLYKVEN